MTIRGIGKKIEAIGVPLLLLCIILKIFYSEPFIYSKNFPFYIRIIGSLIFLIGIIIHYYSAYMMIKAFKGKKLLTTGPFAICRNPMYSTLIFMVAPGLSLILNMWLILAEIPVLLLIFFKNIKEEENYLLEQFKDEYTNYKKHVTRLIPKVL